MLETYYADDLCTIYCGDSRELLPLLDADVMVCDPPYGISDSGGAFDGIANDATVDVRDAVLEAWGNRRAFVFGAPHMPPPPRTVSAACWQKTAQDGLFGAFGGFRRDFELIYLTGPWRREMAGSTSGVLRTSVRENTSAHRHEKPTSLLRELIGKCPPGTIIDPFMGSGSTLRAAKDLGRKCIGIEVDEKWCEVAVRRLAQENLFAT